MADHCGRLCAQALFGVGAAFDYLSGDISEAPGWMQRAGLEWLFRTTQDPKRLVPRDGRNNLSFIKAVARHRPRLLSDGSAPREHAPLREFRPPSQGDA